MNRPAVETAYIGVGSNLSEPVQQVLRAIAELKSFDVADSFAASSLYRSPPMGPSDQPDYINAVVRISTDLPPHQLLLKLQALENDHGRTRTVRWGARTLDLDLLLYAEQRIDTDQLRVPHPGISERDFVLLPLAEIEPDVAVPGLGVVSKLVEYCPMSGAERYVE